PLSLSSPPPLTLLQLHLRQSSLLPSTSDCPPSSLPLSSPPPPIILPLFLTPFSSLLFPPPLVSSSPLFCLSLSLILIRLPLSFPPHSPPYFLKVFNRKFKSKHFSTKYFRSKHLSTKRFRSKRFSTFCL
ncbi:hypothetical protein LINPERPRIM_LOCUS5129, partial [Linum perenne]